VKGVKKSNAKKVVISSIFVSVCVLCLVVGMAELSAADNSPMAITIREGRPLPESLSLNVQAVSQNSSYSNVSLLIINCGATSLSLYKIQVAGTSVLTYINGTEIIDPSQMSYNLEIGGTMQVNLIVPIANYSPNATITVYTPEAMYYQKASVF
jgi:hypothetical protein